LKPTQNNPGLHAEGMVTKEALALALVDLRRLAGLRPVELARRAGWPPGTVSRLESVKGQLPDLATIARYGKACGVDIGMIFASVEASSLFVHSALTLQSARQGRWYEQLYGQAINPRDQSW